MARRCSRLYCSGTSAICGATWSRTAPCSATTPAILTTPSPGTRTATTRLSGIASAIRSCSPRSWRSCSGDLPQPRLRRLFYRHPCCVLGAAPLVAEPLAAGDELFLLRLRPPLVPHADSVVDVD